MADKIIEFESPHFLHSLFADDVGMLKEMGEKLGITVTTRDAWVKLEGNERSISAGQT